MAESGHRHSSGQAPKLGRMRTRRADSSAKSGAGPEAMHKLGHVPRTGRVHQFTIGDRLRKAREVAGYDQRGFEEATGISRGTISAYELGKSTPRRAFLSIWAVQTDTDLNWLLTGEPTEDNDPVADLRTD